MDDNTVFTDGVHQVHFTGTECGMIRLESFDFQIMERKVYVKKNADPPAETAGG